MRDKDIKSNSGVKTSVLGVFEGECADANITNKNGLDITAEVWENVFNSDEYRQAIELGWYIGFLGHPDDPNCMDFEHACIVMTEGSIDANGKIQGKFNLVDTPVGKIVKAFIDAGVTFGISVRGAGDIVNNSVDPETFVFRGFDLVSFPAFPESIPTFTEIAASSDIESQKKYSRICAAVNQNIDALNTSQSIEIVQSCFAKQSDEYKALEQKKQSILSAKAPSSDIVKDRLNGMTELYLASCEDIKHYQEENAQLRTLLANRSLKNSRKLKAIKRIMAAQIDNLSRENDVLGSEIQELEDRVSSVQLQNLKYKRKVEASKKLLRDRESELHELSDILSSTKKDLSDLSAELAEKDDVIASQSDELSSKDAVIASTKSELQKRDSELSQLQSDLDETVRKHSEIEASTSNFDAQVNELSEELTAAYTLLEEYQNAYARIYANAVGVDLSEVPGSITASTTVRQLQKIIGGSGIHETSKPNSKLMSVSPDGGNSLITL